MEVLVAVDAGTTGVRTLAFDLDGRQVAGSYRKIAQSFPQPGWVEQDPGEIRDLVLATLVDTARELDDAGHRVAAIGVTNQRETVVPFDPSTGKPSHPAIVWQDRRTAPYCNRLQDEGLDELVRSTTGLLVDPYFSATKIRWLADRGYLAGELVAGTVDSWIVWNLAGGQSNSPFVTDFSNASRTMLLDLTSLTWSREIAGLLGVDTDGLAEIVPSMGEIAPLSPELRNRARCLRDASVFAIAGDQQAALFGQQCFTAGMAKATYGTGSFVVVNAGQAVPSPPRGLVASIGWHAGGHSAVTDSGGTHSGGTDPITYILEGSIFSAGATIQWLCDGLGIIADPTEVGPLAARAKGAGGGVYLVPAFTGLGSPWWDPSASATITGLARGIGRADIARAAIESIAFRVRDVLDTAEKAGYRVNELRVDGGVSAVDLLLRIQADQAGVPVRRPVNRECTAIGIAAMAGIGAGIYGSATELSRLWQLELEAWPSERRDEAEAAYAGWLRAIERSRGPVGAVAGQPAGLVRGPAEP